MGLKHASRGMRSSAGQLRFGVCESHGASSACSRACPAVRPTSVLKDNSSTVVCDQTLGHEIEGDNAARDAKSEHPRHALRQTPLELIIYQVGMLPCKESLEEKRPVRMRMYTALTAW